ncbi:hypothetical protein Tco_0236100 [Tanacetum coccineum]
MSTLTFADTHNMVAFLEKPAESDGFHEIIDFLNANQIRYALTVNPTIYTSCIQQFWATAKAKTVNGVRQIQALIDKKKLIITETSIRSDLHLEDAEGMIVGQLLTIFEIWLGWWKYLIHTITQCLSAKSTAWNEFSNTMASLIICLATNQRFNLSKYIFDAMVKHLDGGVKFLMYPRFLQVFINQQLGDMSHHKKIFVTPSHTKKIFANMKREGKDFSGRITPLFETMMVQPTHDEGVDSDNNIPTPSNDPPLSGEDRMQLSELMLLCTNLQKQVLDLEKAKDAQAKEIADLKKRVQRLERKKKSRTTGLKRLKKVGMSRRVESYEDQESLGETKEKGIIQEPERPLTKKDQVALDEDLARNIQAQLDAKIIEEERLERQKQEEANIALIESWENTQAMIEADRLLAERLQTREREELTDEEKGKLFMELMEKRRKHFAALRAQEKRNRPPTKATK